VKPSEKIKALGFKSMGEAANALGEPHQSLIRWSKTYPRRFELILKGLAFERMNAQLMEVFDTIDDDDNG